MERSRSNIRVMFLKRWVFGGINVSQTHLVDVISLFAAELEEPKIGISGKWLG